MKQLNAALRSWRLYGETDRWDEMPTDRIMTAATHSTWKGLEREDSVLCRGRSKQLSGYYKRYGGRYGEEA